MVNNVINKTVNPAIIKTIGEIVCDKQSFATSYSLTTTLQEMQSATKLKPVLKSLLIT